MAGSGLRHTSHNSDNKGLNSSSGIDSNRRQRTFRGMSLRYGLLVAFISGASMTGGRTTAAQPRAASEKEILEYKNKINTQLQAVDDRLKQQEDMGFTPALPWTDGTVRPLLVNLHDANEVLKATNGGENTIPVTGYDEEGFRSLNRWLGRDENAPLDAAAVDTLRNRLALIFSPVDDAADTIAGAVLDLPSETGLGGVVPTPAPPSEAPAPPVETGIPQEKQENYELMVQDLGVIAEHGKTRKIKTKAKRYRDKLQAALDNDDEEALDKANRRSRIDTFITKHLNRAQDAKLAAATVVATTEAEATGQEVAFSGEIGELHNSLQSIQSKYPVASQMVDWLPSVYLLGARGKQQMIKNLTDANLALQTGDVAKARQHFDKAKAVYNAEQELYGHFLQFVVVPTIDTSLQAANSSTLPTGKELKEMEVRDDIQTSVPKGTKRKDRKAVKEEIEDRRYYRTTSRGVHNGKEDFSKAFLEKKKSADEYLANNLGSLSYNYVWDLYRSTADLNAAFTSLDDMWRYAQANRLNSANEETRQNFMRGYAEGSVAILDPNERLNYSATLIDVLKDQYLKNTGNMLDEDQLMRILQNSKEFKYQQGLYAVYQRTAAMAPDLSTLLSTYPSNVKTRLTSAVDSIASLRTARTLYAEEYSYYDKGIFSDIDSFLEDSHYFLTNAVEVIKASGVSEDNEFVQYARQKLNIYGKIDKSKLSSEEKKKLAESFYDFAMNLVAIREAELWSQNQELLSSQGKSELQNAVKMIDDAKEIFRWNVSVPEVDSTYYSGLPRHISDRAVNIMVPPLKYTEMHARFTLESNISTVQTNKADAEDKGHNIIDNPAKIREAVVADRANVRDSAEVTSAEKEHMRLLLSLNNFAFGEPSASEKILSQTNWSNALEALRFDVGRQEVFEPDMGITTALPSESRKRVTLERVDQRSFGATPREANAIYPQGHLIAEVYRQVVLHADPNTPELLKQLGTETVSMRRSMDNVSARYTNIDPQAQLKAANLVLLQRLDQRIAELEERLAGNRTTDGVPIAKLSLSKEPAAYYVLRAKQALLMAKEERRRIAFNINSNLFDRDIDPREAIMVAEIGIESLSDKYIDPIPKPDLVRFILAGTEAKIRDKEIEGLTFARATAPDVLAVLPDGKKMDLEDYKGPEKERLTFNWLFYQNVGGTYMLLNPLWNPLTAKGRTEKPFIGRVMRNVELPDGTRGPAVVAVRPPGSATGASPEVTVEWEPEIGSNGKPIVLYRLQVGAKISLSPVEEDMTAEMLETATKHTTGPNALSPTTGGKTRAITILNQ